MVHHRAEKSASAPRRPPLGTPGNSPADGKPAGDRKPAGDGDPAGDGKPAGDGEPARGRAQIQQAAPRGQHRAKARQPRTQAALTRGRHPWPPRLLSAPGLLGAGVLVVAAAGVTGALVWGSPTGATDTAGATGAGSISSSLSRPVTAARAAPDVSGSESVLTGTRDRRERAVSRDAHREAELTASTRRLQAVTEKAARKRTAALAGLAAGARRQAEVIAANTWQLPVAAGAYHLTSRFGDCSALWSNCHTGLDFAGPQGTPIHAVAAGTITEIGYAGAYGNRTIMATRDGTELWYCHQSATSVAAGDQVVAGQVIGAIGSTGNTTGPHLHLEVRPNPKVPVDPFAALVAHGLQP